MNHARIILFPIVALITFAPLGTADDTLSIPLNDLDAFRPPLGEWEVVVAAALDPVDPTKLQSAPGKGVAVNGANGRTEHLVTKHEHGDIDLHIEFMVPKGSNSGVYLQGRYEIQILDSWGVQEVAHSDCGGIYQRWNNAEGIAEDDRGYEGRPPILNASRPPGVWQSFDIVFQAPRFDADGNKTANARFLSVKHNGITIHQDEELTGPTRAAMFSDEKPLGPLMLQGDHGPVAFRNLRITPLDE